MLLAEKQRFLLITGKNLLCIMIADNIILLDESTLDAPVVDSLEGISIISI